MPPIGRHCRWPISASSLCTPATSAELSVKALSTLFDRLHGRDDLALRRENAEGQTAIGKGRGCRGAEPPIFSGGKLRLGDGFCRLSENRSFSSRQLDDDATAYNEFSTINAAEMMALQRQRADTDSIRIIFLTRVFPRPGMIFQCALVGATAALMLTPPAEGMMLVAPLLPVSAARTLDWVLPAGARLVAPGPYTGSFIMYAARSALIASAITHSTLLLNSRFFGCGSRTRTIL